MTTEYSGTGDPARSLALLWRTREPTSRKSRPDLNVGRIARTAIDIADTDGLAALSMRKVAERLGVGTMSLYTYIPGKSELLDVMLDLVYGDAHQTPTDTCERPEDPDNTGHHSGTGGPTDRNRSAHLWRHRLERVARDNWHLHRRHPWLLQIAVTRPTLGPHATAKYDHELAAIDGIGLADLEMDSVLTLVLSFVHATARGAIDAAQAERHTGMTDEQWWRVHAPYLEKTMDPARYPRAARVGTAAGEARRAAVDPEHAFEFGLARLLDGIDVLVRQRHAETPAAAT